VRSLLRTLTQPLVAGEMSQEEIQKLKLVSRKEGFPRISSPFDCDSVIKLKLRLKITKFIK
jgi:hypothetical protein